MNKFCPEHDKTDYQCRECRLAYQRWHYQNNKDRYKEKHSQWYQENKEAFSKKTTQNARKRRFGVTPEQFQSMLEGQQHTCPICSVVLDQSACVDHNHTTGKVRGLLCKQCNMGLGLFWDDKEKLKNAIFYLEKND